MRRTTKNARFRFFDNVNEKHNKIFVSYLPQNSDDLDKMLYCSGIFNLGDDTGTGLPGSDTGHRSPEEVSDLCLGSAETECH